MVAPTCDHPDGEAENELLPGLLAAPTTATSKLPAVVAEQVTLALVPVPSLVVCCTMLNAIQILL